MGFFDFFKKNKDNTDNTITQKRNQPYRDDFKSKLPERNCLKSQSGLLPHEILLLTYYEKYKAGHEIARFWSYKYGVEDVNLLMQLLEERGFASEGNLSALGLKEVEENPHVVYMHRNGSRFDVSMDELCTLVNKNPSINWRDLLWGELNRKSLMYMNNKQYGYYRNVKSSMCRMLEEEKKHEDALDILSEVFFYDLNSTGRVLPNIVPPGQIQLGKSIIKNIDISPENLYTKTLSVYRNLFSPYKNFRADEAAFMFVCYMFGKDEDAEKILLSKVEK